MKIALHHFTENFSEINKIFQCTKVNNAKLTRSCRKLIGLCVFSKRGVWNLDIQIRDESIL